MLISPAVLFEEGRRVARIDEMYIVFTPLCLHLIPMLTMSSAILWLLAVFLWFLPQMSFVPPCIRTESGLLSSRTSL